MADASLALLFIGVLTVVFWMSLFVLSNTPGKYTYMALAEPGQASEEPVPAAEAPKDSGPETEKPERSLVCGVLSLPLYAGIDALGGTMWRGYSFVSGAVSDLSAIGSPVRPIVAPLFVGFDALFMAFALSVLAVAGGGRRAMRVLGGLLVAYGAVNFAAIFTPEHLGEAPTTLGNSVHIAAAGVTTLLFLAQFVAGVIAFRGWFRFYSAGTLLAVLVFGVYIFAGVSAGQLVQWVGVTERILIYGSMLWQAVLAVVLLRSHKGQAQLQNSSPRTHWSSTE